MKLSVQAHVQTDPATAWSVYNTPEHITRWNAASDDWHSPRSEVDLRAGGRFRHRMEARDGSAGFDFEGVFTRVVPPRELDYRMDDGREARVRFTPSGEGVDVQVSFDPDRDYPAEYQQDGWQAILERYARYAATVAPAPAPDPERG